MQAVLLQCPGCGERITADMKKCPQCRAILTITSFDEVKNMRPRLVGKYIESYTKTLSERPDEKDVNMSVALCYLKLRLYDRALYAFDKAIENMIGNSDAFFYAAICVLKGRKPFLCPRIDIDTALSYVNAAIAVEQKAIYGLFSAYIKYDYFKRKSYKTAPDYSQELAEAKALGVSPADYDELFSLLGATCPSALT